MILADFQKLFKKLKRISTFYFADFTVLTLNKSDDYHLLRKYHSSEYVKRVLKLRHARDGKINIVTHGWIFFYNQQDIVIRNYGLNRWFNFLECKILSFNCQSFKTQMI